DELARAPQFLERTAGRSEAEYRQMLTQQVPGLTNMLICGLIFCAGRFAVVRDMLYCVDFSERIPNCIALYLLLIAQKQPADKRSQGLDLGDGTDPAPLKAAIETLQVCDPSWQPKILWP
ncbi:MAG: hypothetical protein IK095_10110, partial [Oscillospiraceae bacterium]|nr:hypothetical protein [Oscillospiraceae bacterium]